jgi:hypothetical protein
MVDVVKSLLMLAPVHVMAAERRVVIRPEARREHNLLQSGDNGIDRGRADARIAQ